MAPMNMRQLEAFRALMLSGSVTGAADLLRVTQPSVSKLIAQLEDNTGLQLFDRVRGRLVPRPEAKTLFPQVDKAFAVLEETARNARRLAQGTSGHLRIVSIPAIGLELMPTVIGQFLKDRPNATVEFNIRASTYVEEWVGNRQVDVGFATATATGAAVVSQPLATLQGVCVLPKGHRLAGRPVIEAADLANERFISLGRDTAFRQFLDRAFEDAGVARRIVIETGYSAAVCSLVAAGVGASVLDPFSALDGWRKGGVALASFRPEVPFSVNSLFPLDAPRPSVLSEFLSVLAAGIEVVESEIRVACGVSSPASIQDGSLTPAD